MTEPIARIVVPWDPARTSENAIRKSGKWWPHRHRMFAAARTAAHCAWLKAGSPRSSGKVRASFVVCRGRRMDACNVIGGLKPIIDGIFCDALTPDDGPGFLELGMVIQNTGARFKGCETVEVVVEECLTGEPDLPQSPGRPVSRPPRPAAGVLDSQRGKGRETAQETAVDAPAARDLSPPGANTCPFCGRPLTVEHAGTTHRARCACGKSWWRRCELDKWEPWGSLR